VSEKLAQESSMTHVEEMCTSFWYKFLVPYCWVCVIAITSAKQQQFWSAIILQHSCSTHWSLP